jgi:hypothetical protein
LKHHREIDESSSAKSDQRDALTIANITREGKYIDTIIEDGVLRQREDIIEGTGETSPIQRECKKLFACRPGRLFSRTA